MIGIGGKGMDTNTGFIKLLFHPPSNLRKIFAGEEACTDEIMSAKKNERKIPLVNQSRGFSLQCVAGADHCTLDIVWRFAEFK
jgi:hypothetical protein